MVIIITHQYENNMIKKSKINAILLKKRGQTAVILSVIILLTIMRAMIFLLFLIHK